MLLRPDSEHRPPGWLPARAWADALAEDTYEVLAGLAGVQAAVVCGPAERDRAAALIWPGTPVHLLPAGGGSADAALRVLIGAGAQAGAVVADDAPDLPPLLLGKLYSALTGRRSVAASPAGGSHPGGLVALAGRAPLPAWLPAVSLDDPDALARLRAAAPPGELAITPGWQRLSGAGLDRLDPGLEGWPATRALLAGSYPAAGGAGPSGPGGGGAPGGPERGPA